MTKKLSEADIIKLSMLLLSEDDAQEVRQDAQVLLMNVHRMSRHKPSWHKPMFGEAMSYELFISWDAGLTRSILWNRLC